MSIPTFVINLSNRTDRRSHIEGEFLGRNEFDLTIFEAIKAEVGAIGLWLSIRQIIQKAICDGSEYIIICEDDHLFTDSYSERSLRSSIEMGKQIGADVILGGASAVSSLFRVFDSLLWLDGFTGTQFMVVYHKFYSVILNAEFGEFDSADDKIAHLSSRIFLFYPFISVQKEFGYSDATNMNNDEGRVEELFVVADQTTEYLLRVQSFYESAVKTVEPYDELDTGDLKLTTYLYGLNSDDERLGRLKKEFVGREEFELIFNQVEHSDNVSVRIWNCIRNAVECGVHSGDDVIAVCFDTVRFSNNYSAKQFFENILEANDQGVDLLLGGVTRGFNHVIRVSANRFWINYIYGGHFLVIYSKFYSKILESEFLGSVGVDAFLSSLTKNKMVIYPFISEAIYSEITDLFEFGFFPDDPNLMFGRVTEASQVFRS